MAHRIDSPTTLTLLGALVVLLSAPAQAFELRKDSTGTVVRWANSLRFVVDPSFSRTLGVKDGDAALARAAATLNAGSPAPNVELVSGATSGQAGFRTAAGAVNQSEVFAVTQWPFPEDALAATVISVDLKRHVVIDADIVFNASRRRLDVVDASSTGHGKDKEDTYDLQGTATHEFGHALGLLHTQVEGAVMWPKTFPKDLSKRVVQVDDVEGLTALYGDQEIALQQPGADLPQGCSAAPGSATGALGLLAGLLLARRRRSSPGHGAPTRLVMGARFAAVLVAVVSTSALAGEPPAAFSGEVVAVSTTRADGVPGLLVTHVTVHVKACHTATCERFVVVPVAGGIDGDVEQIVNDNPVPRLGDAVGVMVPQKGQRAALFGLARKVERSRFEAALAAAAPR